MFARYSGARIPNMTVGKIYLAKPEVNGAETIALTTLEVISDSGDVIRVDPEHEQFEYFDEVYAVAAKPFEDIGVGEVITLDGTTDDGGLYHMKGVGYRDASFLVILDKTNVFPGMSVLDGVSGRWVRVRRVDECLWVTTGDRESFRSPSEFEFAVSGGDLLRDPIVRCVSATGRPNLTEGRLYHLKGRDKDGMPIIKDDSGQEKAYMATRFSMES